MMIALDIETIPNPDMIPLLPEPDVKLGNLKDPAKIAEKKAEAKRDQVADMALDPLTARLACACAVGVDSGSEYERSVCLEELTDADEQAKLEPLFTILGTADVRLITWNGAGFDLPFLYKRACILGVDIARFGVPPLTAWTKRYGSDRHFDLMQIWTGWQGFAKLDTVARLILREGKQEMDPAAIPALMATPEGRGKVVEYCMQDTRLTWRLCERMQGYLFA